MIARMSPLAAVGFLALVSMNAWLISVMIDENGPDDSIATGSLGAQPKIQSIGDASVATKSLASYSQTLEQPIFSKTRTPFVPPPPPPPAPLPSATPPQVHTDPGLVLGGVMVNGKLRKAYLFTKANPQGTWVDEGENFMGWKVRSVHSTTATLQQQSRKIELHLYPPQ